MTVSTKNALPTRAYVFWGLLTSNEQWQAENLIMNLKRAAIASSEIEGIYLSAHEKRTVLDMPEPMLYLARRRFGSGIRNNTLAMMDTRPGDYPAGFRKSIAEFPMNFFGLLKGSGIIYRETFLPRIEALLKGDSDNRILMDLKALFLREDHDPNPI